MSSSVGTRRIVWHGGEHDFCVASLGQLLAIEDRCKASLATIFGRLASQRWGLHDIRETIRQGLIGGGLAPALATRLVRQHVDVNPDGLAESRGAALLLIEAALVGMPGDLLAGHPSPDTGGPNKSPDVFADDGRLRRSVLLGFGAGLGWSPAVTYAATTWELAACVDGFNRANGGPTPIEPPSDDEFDAMLKLHGVHATVQ